MKNITHISSAKKFNIYFFKEIIRYKDLFFRLVLKDIYVLYKQTVLGFSWAIIRPFLSMVVFTFVFGNLANIPSDGIPYPIFSYAALVPWTYFSSALQKSNTSLISNIPVFTKVYFPRILLPLSPIISSLVDFFIAISILFLMFFAYDIQINSNIIFLPLLLLMLVLTCSGFGMFLSVLAIQYRDFRHFVPFFITIMMYVSPVVWPASKILEKFGEQAYILYGFYPLSGIIEGFRSAMIGHNPMPWQLIIPSIISSVFLFFFGLIFFTKQEKYIADVY
tara:strand:+ start:24 stop:857 length:834 start_codon:yes stop_codon:yes gene_type:complete